jgi:3'(2'), 5'-bisphosphate nucleotidase
MTYTREKQVALEAVTLAAELCRAVRSEIVGVGALAKDDKSPVTIADFGSQALVCQRLKATFPQDVIVGEEDSSDLRKSGDEPAATLAQVTQYVRRFQPGATPETICGWIDAGNGQVADRFWTLDPIDGTKGFLRNDQYAIALALIEGGQVKVAVLGCPALPLDMDDPNSPKGVLFAAVHGEGAAMIQIGGSTITSVRVAQDSEQARRRFVESVEADHGHAALQQAIARAAGISQPPLRMDSQVKYGAIARGDAGLYLRLPSPKSPDYREKIWDHAAGSLIVEEAGGRVTDMHGRRLDFASDYKMNDNRGVIAGQGALHAAALAALAQV